MDRINKLVRDSFFLRFAANEDTPPTEPPQKELRFNSLLLGLVTILSLALGFGLAGDRKLNAQEVNIPSLPLAYTNEENILNTDFTKPLPELKLTINGQSYSCGKSLETPPTLIEGWIPCITPSENILQNTEQLVRDDFENFLKAQANRTLKYGNNQYTIINQKI